jgi:tellurite resistance protein
MRPHRALFLAALLASPTAAWPRAGGGQSFSGSRSSSSSSRTSGGSSSSSRSSPSSSWSSRSSAPSYPIGAGAGAPYPSSPVYSVHSGGGSSGALLVLFVLAIGFGIALVVVIPILRGVRARGASSALEDAWQRRRAEGQQSPEELERFLASIRARDPSFDAEAFLLSARKAFVEVQHAWSAGDFSSAHRLLSDGVLRRFTAQLALNKALGKRNVTTGLQVRAAALAAAESDAAFDTLHVRFQAALRDCDVPADAPEAAALVQASRAEPSEFAEVWSFVRRLTPGGRSGALSEGMCPNCGAPALRVPNATCPYCQAVLNSGAYDWVLSEITQESEFECRPTSAVEGLSALQQADPDANRQVLEDRAGLVFWKWAAAVGTRRLDSFERLCAPEVYRQLCASPPRISGIEQCAVGGVDLVRVEAAAERQRALFLLRWSTSGAGTGIVRTNVLALTRAAHVRTNPRLGLSTDRCHHCGAPQNELDAVRCGHCQALLTQDWSFEELGEPEGLHMAAATGGSGAEERPTAALADPRERRRVLAALVALARADGEVSAGEWELLEGYAQRWSIERGYLDGLFAAPVDQLLDLRPRNPEAARSLYGALCAAAWADGRIDASERRMLAMAAASLRIPEEARVQLERAAKDSRFVA